MQSDPSQVPAQPEPAESPHPEMAETPPPKKFNAKILLLILLILAVGGLGTWTIMGMTNLKAAQAKLEGLQGKYDDLTAQNSQLKTELAQVSSELDGINAELSTTNETLKTAKSDLSKSRQENSALQSKKSNSTKFVVIMASLFNADSSDFLTYFLVFATNDEENKELFSKFAKTHNSTDLSNWIKYVISKAIESLN